MSPAAARRIVLVDDQEKVRYVHGSILRRAGFDVIEGASGEDALRLVQAIDPACLICDVNLPDIDGYAVCRWVRDRPASASMPLVLVSASRIGERDRVRGLEGGADAYLTEPIEPRVLLATVRSLIRARRTAEGLARLQGATAGLSGAVTQLEVGEVLLLHAMRSLAAQSGVLALATSDSTHLAIVTRAGPRGDELAARVPSLPVDSGLALAEAFRSGEPVVLRLPADAGRCLGEGAAPIDGGLGLALPVALGARRLGALLLVVEGQREGLDEEDRDLLLTLTVQAAQALERAQLFERAEAQREAEETARTRAQLLGAIGASLDAAAGLEEEAEALMDVLVPRAARLAAVVVARAEGRSCVASARTADGAGDPAALAGDLRAHCRAALEEGAPEAAAGGVLRDAEVRARLAALGAPSPLLLPLAVGREQIGALLLAVDPASPEGQHLRDEGFLESLAQRAALSLQNARLWERARQIALELQHSLLPSRLPEVAGIEVAGRYEGAVAGLQVGGDWYDAITLPRGRLGVAVGDVVGRGLAAAAVMGQLRSGMSAMALSAEGPAELLERLEDFAGSVEGGEFATAAYATLDPSTGELSYACAGHPPPLLLLPDGSWELLSEGRSAPLCGIGNRRRGQATRTMPPGARLVLYTDGLVERRGEVIDQGFARLGEVAAAHRDLPLESFCAALIERMRSERDGADDVAVLALELGPAPTARLVTTVAPEPAALAGLRATLRPWLAEHGVGEDAALGMILAIGEACANAIEHAFIGVEPSEITVDVRLEPDGRLVAHVRDGGRWRHMPSRGDRGRGIRLMRQLADEVTVQSTRAGTRTTIVRRLSGPASAR